MATATPETLGTIFSQIISEAEEQAGDQAGPLKNLLNSLGQLPEDKAADLPNDVWRDLKDLVDPPKWWSVLVFLMVQASKADPHLKAGAMQPEGWSRMVTLTYDNTPVPSITLGLALLKDTAPDGHDLKRGVLISIAGPIPLTSLQSDGPVGLSIAASVAAQWKIPFSGPIEPPDHDATADLTLTWNPPDLTLGADGITTGPARVAVQLNSDPVKLYALSIGLGDPKDWNHPGLRAAVDLSPKLGVLGEVVKIAKIDERYSPQYTRSKASSSAFELNHVSAG